MLSVVRPHIDMINGCMFTHWQELLPSAIDGLNPLHRDILTYIMNLPGKQRTSYAHAERTWNLSRTAFDAEVAAAFQLVRQHLKRYGIAGLQDLDLV